MFASGVITFRETLEAALVVGILLTFLTKTNQIHYKKYIWNGLFLGIFLSIVLAVILNVFLGGFTGRSEEIFEGVLMFITAGFLTWMILWVHRQKGVAKQLEKKVVHTIREGFPVGLIFLTTTAVLREGIETVLYLRAVSTISQSGQLLGAVLGICIAVIISYGVFKFSLQMHLGKVLKLSGALLLLFAAGLIAHGVHEFQEAALLPMFAFDPLINISHILDNSSFFGSMLRALFGYSAKPSLLEVLSYGMYVGIIFLLEIWTTKLLFMKNKPISFQTTESNNITL